MSVWRIHTPEGMQDILIEECRRKRDLEEKLRVLFKSFNYLELETPAIEYYDVFSGGGCDFVPQEATFKFTDGQGRLLVMRPDMTIPVARIAATKYKEYGFPLRFSYIGNVYRYNESGGGKQKEFTQAGIELMGASTPEADAEVIAVSINALKGMGIEDIRLDIGHIGFFKGLMDASGFSAEDRESVLAFIDGKDFIGLQEIVERHCLEPELETIITGLPGLFGSRELIADLNTKVANKRSKQSLEYIGKVLSLLDEYGVGRYVSIDLGMVQSLEYYTGIIFRGFTYGVGFPVLSGGRYDGVVGRFGKKCPATGFSLGVNMVMTALERQGHLTNRDASVIAVTYKGKGRKTAFCICDKLRQGGAAVETDVMGKELPELMEGALERGIDRIIDVAREDDIRICHTRTGVVKKTSMAELFGGQG